MPEVDNNICDTSTKNMKGRIRPIDSNLSIAALSTAHCTYWRTYRCINLTIIASKTSTGLAYYHIIPPIDYSKPITINMMCIKSLLA